MNTQAQIAELEERLRLAMLHSDVVELDTLIAPELIFTSYLGQRISKQQNLELHRSVVLKLTELIPSEQHIQCYEGFSIVSVQMHLLGRYQDTAVDEYIRYTRIWSDSSDGPLQIVAGHASIILS